MGLQEHLVSLRPCDEPRQQLIELAKATMDESSRVLPKDKPWPNSGRGFKLGELLELQRP